MKTILVIDKFKIECKGISTYPINDFINDRLNNAHNKYNVACDNLKAKFITTLPEYPTIEDKWFILQDWLGVYNVVKEVTHEMREGRHTFPNMGGYIEVIK